MYENRIEFDKMDFTQEPPVEEPQRQYYYIARARAYVKAESERLGRPLTCVVTTFGCQMNARDSEKLSGILRQIGYVETTEEEQADIASYKQFAEYRNICANCAKSIITALSTF